MGVSPMIVMAVSARITHGQDARATLAKGAAVKIGFGKESFFELLKPAFNGGFTDMTLADELSIITLVASEKSTTIVLVVADCEFFWPAVATAIRRQIAGALDLPVEHVSLFATQNHFSAVIPDEATARFAALCVQAARQGIKNLQSAEMMQVTVRPEPPLNFCRRIVLPELGAFTFWIGHRDAGPGRADVGHMLDLSLRNVVNGQSPVRLKRYPPDTPIPRGQKVVLLPRAEDDALQALFFRTKSGVPIGSLLRFAAHPCTGEPSSTHCRYTGDFPAYARRKLEREFGGMAIFLTGPCGDSTPLIERRSQALAEKFGEQIAAEVLRVSARSAWIEPEGLDAREVNVSLPVRRDFPRSLAAVDAEVAQIAARLTQRKNLPENKRLLDRMEVLHCYKLKAFSRHTGYFKENLRPDTMIEHPLPVIRIGPAVIAGLPGEPFNEYSVRLRNETLGDSLIVCDEANGYLGYIPSSGQVPLGGYGVNFSLFDDRAEEVLLAAVKAGIACLGT